MASKYADAEELYKRALEIKEKALGSDHPNVAKTLYNLALTARRMEAAGLMWEGTAR